MGRQWEQLQTSVHRAARLYLKTINVAWFFLCIFYQFLQSKGRQRGEGEGKDLQTWVKWTSVNRIMCEYLGQACCEEPSSWALDGSVFGHRSVLRGYLSILVMFLFFSLDLWMLKVPEGRLFEALSAYWYPFSSGSFLSSHLILGMQASSN